ncbi:MAG: hypothetical protein JRI56_00020 [Deltaproteobacteria bacterium]|nr:hypothetical protein [Deltaproteobacteria bacterium]
MNINDAIGYLEERTHSLSNGEFSERDRLVLKGILKLLKRLPATMDGCRVLPGDELIPPPNLGYASRLSDPVVEMKVHFVLEDGTHIVDEVENYLRYEDECC